MLKAVNFNKNKIYLKIIYSHFSKAHRILRKKLIQSSHFST